MIENLARSPARAAGYAWKSTLVEPHGSVEMSKPLKKSRLYPVILLFGACLFAGHPLAAQAESTTLRAIPHASLRTLDPIASSAYITRNYALMVYETLFAPDSKGVFQLQMLESYDASPDGLVHTFKLRDGLKFHSGAAVTSADCIASIKRWAKRDPVGGYLMGAAESFEPVDDRTFKLTLKRAVGGIPDILGKISAYPAVIMPERLAKASPSDAITESDGSGPFVFKKDEWQPGVKAVFVKNTAYKPRSEAADGLAGGRVVKVDRVEWVSLPDPNTAVAALQTGEVDFFEAPPLDLIKTIEASGSLALVKATSLSDTQGWIRPNQLQPPFDKASARQALLKLVNQSDFLRAIGASETSSCLAYFLCGSPNETKAGSEAAGKVDIAAAKALLAEAGYHGEKIVILQATDIPVMTTAAQVLGNQLRKAGATVELRAMDYSTIVARRVNKSNVQDGGWSILVTYSQGVDAYSPLNNIGIVSTCENAYYGWPCDPETEKLRLEWAASTDGEAKRTSLNLLQTRVYQALPYVLWGQFAMPMAYNKDNLSGYIPAVVPVFWGVEKKAH